MTDKARFIVRTLLLLLVLGAVAGLFTLANLDTRSVLLPDSQEYPDLYFAAKQGTLAAMVFLLGVFGISKLPRGRWIASAILLVILSPLALGGFWFSKDALGISDWDYYFSYHTELRNMLLVQHTFPLWNPYTCGGTSAIGDPEFPVFSPLFWIEMLFGIPVGYRLVILTAAAVGGIGMLLLGKRFKLSPLGSLLAAVVYMLSTRNLLEVVEGHPNVFSLMWIPWIFWAWIAAYRQKSPTWMILSGLFLSLTFFQGGIFPLTYTAMALLAIIILSGNRLRALRVTLLAGLWSLGFAAIKLLPALFWLASFQKERYATSAFTLFNLHKILLGRFLHGVENVIPNQGTGWHEYGAYIGPVVVFLALLGLAQIKRLRYVRILFIGAVLALLASSAGPWLKPFFDTVPALPRSNFARIVIYAVMALSLLGGVGLDRIRRWRFGRIFAPVILGLVVLDLATLSYALSLQAFVLPNVVPAPPKSVTPISYTLDTHTYRHNGIDYTRSYANVQQGYGTLSYCSVLGPQAAIKPIQYTDEDTRYVTINDPNGKVTLKSWTPNKIIVSSESTIPTTVIINANSAPGWYVNDGIAKEVDNRLAATVDEGNHDLIFEYKPRGWIGGLIISLTSNIFALSILIRAYRGQSSHRSSPPQTL